MPLGDGITFKYGDYQFDPRPLFTTNKEIIKTPSNNTLATKYSLTLEGTILPTGIDPVEGNIPGLTTVLSGTNVLRDAFSQDFKLLLLQCGSDSPLISGYPKVTSVDVANSNDNYIRRADYTINLELSSLTGSVSEPGGINCAGSLVGGTNLSASGLISLTDEFTIEFVDERVGGDISNFDNTLTADQLSHYGFGGGFQSMPSVFSLQRTLSAQGDTLAGTGCEIDGVGEYIEPWERAKNYVSANLGLNSSMTGLVGLMGLSGTPALNVVNNFRNVSVNKTEGTVNATETWIAATGDYLGTEDFEVTVERAIDNPFTTVSVNATIQGYASINYEGGVPSTTGTKFSNALAMWSGAGSNVSGSILPRVVGVYHGLPSWKGNPSDQRFINIEPLSESIGYNPIGGTVTYSNSYNDRPPHCAPNALTETISFSFNEPNDVFASLTILGRSAGPLLQEIGTVGPRTRDISIDAVIAASTGCDIYSVADPPTDYDALITAYEARLNAEYSQVFTNSFSKSWEPKVGHFTLSKSWTLGSCS